MKFDRRQYLTW